MKKLWSYWSGFLVFFLATSTAFAVTPTGASSSTSNFLGVIAHGQVTHDLGYNTAGMAAIELGARNYRASATVGWAINPANRIKITGEYLRQDIDYSFFSGVTRQWVQQGAVGVGYQYALNDRFQNYFNLNGYYSHAPSVGLSTVTGTYTPASGLLTAFSDARRIAGSNAGGISPGITTHLWQGNESTLAVNWDDVVYNNTLGPKKTAQGFGGTVHITQAIQIQDQAFQIGASAADRAPFDNYTAEVDWIKPYPTSKLTIGIFAGYVAGKQTLPNTSIGGVNVAYAMDTPASPSRVGPQGVQQQSFTSWVSEPAIYMPQVLAIPDEGVTTSCAFATPTFAGPIVGQSSAPFSTQTYNSPTQFTGSNLTYTVSSTLVGASSTVTINSTTGVVTVTGLRSTTSITITATNPCGASVSSNTFNAVFT